MRRAPLLVPIVLFLAGCGTSSDPDPEKVKDSLTVAQGDVLLGEVRSDDCYPFLSIYDWDEDVDHLPAGFDYDTEDLFFDEFDRLWVEFELAVAPWVEPGEYRFEVTYEFLDANSIFREEVEFRFRVHVYAELPGDPVRLEVVRSLTPEERETGADTDLLVGSEE